MTKVISISTIHLTLASGVRPNKATGQPGRPPVTLALPARYALDGFSKEEIEYLKNLGAVRDYIDDEKRGDRGVPEYKVPKHLPFVSNAALDTEAMDATDRARQENEAAARKILAEQEEEQRKAEAEAAEKRAQEQAEADAKRKELAQEEEARRVAAAQSVRQEATEAVQSAGSGETRATTTSTSNSRKTKQAKENDASDLV